jgi:hypothetical protein
MMGPAGIEVSRRAFLALASIAAAGSAREPSLDPGEAATVIQDAGARIGRLLSLETRSAFRDLVRCGRRTRYVSGAGSDYGDGSRERPFREIQRAVVDAEAGDLVLVGDGVYGHLDIAGFVGRSDAWLGIMAENEQVEATVTVPPPTDNFLNVIGSAYVGLYGFEVRGDQRNPNTNGSGISVHGNSHHVAIWANDVHDFPGGGINCFDVDGSHDLIDISYNHIYSTSRFSPMNTSGISIFAPRDLTGSTFEDGFGFRVRGNYIHDVLCTVPFVPGGFDFITDGNGIALDRILDVHGYRKRILVEDNVITGCGARAVHAYGTINVDIAHNTAIGNIRTHSPAITGGVELDGTVDDSVVIRSNVICPLNTPNSTDGVSRYVKNVILGGTQPVPRGNVDLRGEGLAYFVGPLTASTLIDGSSSLSVFASARRT